MLNLNLINGQKKIIRLTTVFYRKIAVLLF